LLLAGGPPEALAAAGVGWVVVESGTAGAMGNAAQTLQRLPAVYRDADLTLYRVGGVSRPASHGKRVAVVAAHVAWLAVLSGAGISALASRRRKHVPSGT
jgi:hypothetical protein